MHVHFLLVQCEDFLDMLHYLRRCHIICPEFFRKILSQESICGGLSFFLISDIFALILIDQRQSFLANSQNFRQLFKVECFFSLRILVEFGGQVWRIIEPVIKVIWISQTLVQIISNNLSLMSLESLVYFSLTFWLFKFRIHSLIWALLCWRNLSWIVVNLRV